MKFILGTKQHMVQYFSENGKVYPATLVKAGPVTVTQIKSSESDGYSAVQLGYRTKSAKRQSKPSVGHLKDLGNFEHLQEIRIAAGGPEMKRGDTVTLEEFKKGDLVRVTGISKGKGFQGVVKRHGFHGGPRSHGQKHSEREPGSIGGGLRTRVPKGMRMAGRMGSDSLTVKNLEILEIHPEASEMLIKGAIPGRKGTIVKIIGNK